MRHRIRWFALHGVVRGLAKFGLRSGDPQARLLADPVVRQDPGGLRRRMPGEGSGDPVPRGVDDVRPRSGPRPVALRRFPRHRTRRQSAQAAALGRREDRPGTLHPLRPPSLLSVEPPDHTRYRKLVSSVFTPRAVAALRERVEQTATSLLDELEGEDAVVDIVDRYCSQLPVTIIGDILGVPDEDRPHILQFGELGAPSLDIGLSWQQYQQVERGHRRVQQLADRPSRSICAATRATT